MPYSLQRMCLLIFNLKSNKTFHLARGVQTFAYECNEVCSTSSFLNESENVSIKLTWPSKARTFQTCQMIFCWNILTAFVLCFSINISTFIDFYNIYYMYKYICTGQNILYTEHNTDLLKELITDSPPTLCSVGVAKLAVTF